MDASDRRKQDSGSAVSMGIRLPSVQRRSTVALGKDFSAGNCQTPLIESASNERRKRISFQTAIRLSNCDRLSLADDRSLHRRMGSQREKGGKFLHAVACGLL